MQQDSQEASRKLSEAQTQTSPESATTAMKSQFPANLVNNKPSHTGKADRRDHTKVVKARSKRNGSPPVAASNQQEVYNNCMRTLNFNKKVKVLHQFIKFLPDDFS